MPKYSAAPTLAAGLIRLARLKGDLTQSELATEAGLSQQVISAYETGRRDPTLESLRRLLEAAGFEIRIHLEKVDPNDQSLEALLQELSPESQAELDRHGKERAEAARLRRIRGH